MHPPRDEAELLERAKAIAGLAVHDVARARGWPLPDDAKFAKGWTGQLIEDALGASAASLPEPDFQLIGVELKTIPVDRSAKPQESTYVCSAPVDGDAPPTWEASHVRRKLGRVLWVPVLSERDTRFADRRIGAPLLWSPSERQEHALRADWEELMDMICLGQLEQISAHHGTCLQIRPKAADSRSRRWGVGASGARVRTQPRGFYLRASFTEGILKEGYVIG